MLLPKWQLEQATKKLDFCTLVFFPCGNPIQSAMSHYKKPARVTKCMDCECLTVIGNWFMHDITCIVFADRIWLIPIPHRLRSLPSAVYASNSPYTISWNVLLIGQRKKSLTEQHLQFCCVLARDTSTTWVQQSTFLLNSSIICKLWYFKKPSAIIENNLNCAEQQLCTYQLI